MNYFLFIHKFAIAPFFYLKLILISFPQNAIPIYIISFISFCFNDIPYFLSSICFKASFDTSSSFSTLSVDLNVGVDNTRVGVTANVGYDTKGENLRGGLGLRIIF